MISVGRARVALTSTVAVALVAAGWYGWWLLAGNLVRHSIEGFSAAERARGGSVAIGAVELGGFPFALRAEVRDLVVSRADGSGWQAPGFTAEAPLWAVTTLAVRLTGAQQITLPAGFEAVAMTATGGEGHVSLGGASGFTAARLGLSHATLQPIGTQIDKVELSAMVPARQPANGGETGLTLLASADGVHFAAAEGQPLGPVIERLMVKARLQGVPPRPSPPALTAWSRSGGSLLIDSALIKWGPVTVESTGALELDRDLQPVGSIKAEVAGFGAAVDALVAGGWVRAKDSHTLKAVLSGLAPHGGARPVVKLPISLHDHFLHVGPFRLAPVPTLVWLGDQRRPNQTTEAPPAIRQ